MIDVTIFLVCYNERVFLPHTIAHYKKYLPSCKIVICDNESTDDSVAIATSLGCSIHTWNTNNITDEYKLRDLKNTIWKSVSKGWVIMADMDEFLCVTEEDLQIEESRGTSILTTIGYNMIGESKTASLEDINLQEITKGIKYPFESKNLCFLREKISDINYGLGAHDCHPTGSVRFSNKVYVNKHMLAPGLPFLITKMIARYGRSEAMRKNGLDTHYIDNIKTIRHQYNSMLAGSKPLPVIL